MKPATKPKTNPHIVAVERHPGILAGALRPLIVEEPAAGDIVTAEQVRASALRFFDEQRSKPDRSQRARLGVHGQLADALAALIAEHGQERVAFAMEGQIAAWVKEDAEGKKRGRSGSERRNGRGA